MRERPSPGAEGGHGNGTTDHIPSHRHEPPRSGGAADLSGRNTPAEFWGPLLRRLVHGMVWTRRRDPARPLPELLWESALDGWRVRRRQAGWHLAVLGARWATSIRRAALPPRAPPRPMARL